MNIRLYNEIAKQGLKRFGENYSVGSDIQSPDGIMVRSAELNDLEFNPELLAISRAGAGVNNIPVTRCTENGIVVFNTPGANANGVKELVLCALMLASRGVVEGAKWAESLTEDIAKKVEKGKKAFAGSEIAGKTLGVIGLGAIGGMVANTAVHLGMDVIGCDPYLSVEAAWNLNHHVQRALSFDEIYKKADYITIHVPATAQTTGMINAQTIAKMKKGVRILNFARGELVSVSDIKDALESGKVAKYVCDFPCGELLGVKNVVATPHLGASTEESEINCAVMAARELADYLENGNIANSVNFPNVGMQRSGKTRICILNSNIPDVISGITSVLSKQGVNIENMSNKSKNDVAYTLVDISQTVSEDTIEQLKAINGVIRVRTIL